MTVGTKRTRVEIQRAIIGRNPDGGEDVERWKSIGGRWARIKPLSGREFFDAGGIEAEVSHKLFLRYDNVTRTMTEKDRIVLASGRVMDVRGIININERNKELEVMAIERK